jgi:Protein of unknown function (DUF2934)
MQSENRSMSIGELAYLLWQARGCPEGTAEQDWLDAERQLRAKQAKATAATSKAIDDSLKDTFPASDPRATRGPDTPPANADAKRKAAGVSRKGSKRPSAPKPSK